jgi:hypothetical protein
MATIHRIGVGEGCFLALLAVVLAGIFIAAFLRRKKKAAEEPIRETRMSFLAGMSFFCGMGAVLVLVVSSIISLCGNYTEALLLLPGDRPLLHSAARIVLVCSLFPAVAAIAFALGARGVIRESQDGLRGKSLYRSGTLLALLAGVFAVMGFRGPEQERVRTIRIREEEEMPRGFLGVEVEPAGTPGAVRVKSVEEGGPAAAAGIKPGDILTAIRARTHRNGMTTFPGSTWDGSKESLRAWIENLRPGDGFVTEVREAKGTRRVEATLAVHPVSKLTTLLREQGFDNERLAVLRPAAARLKFRVDELVRVCAAFDFDAGRVEAIRACLPGLVDPQNGFQLMEALEFQPAKDEVSRLLQDRPPAPEK